MKVIDPDFRTLVAATVRAEMARRQLHQADLAAALGLPRTGISRRLTGHTPFTVDEMQALAHLFEMDVRDLIPEVSSRDRRSGCFTGQLALELEPSVPVEVDIADHRDATAARRRHPTAAANTDRRRAEVTVGAA